MQDLESDNLPTLGCARFLAFIQACGFCLRQLCWDVCGLILTFECGYSELVLFSLQFTQGKNDGFFVFVSRCLVCAFAFLLLFLILVCQQS